MKAARLDRNSAQLNPRLREGASEDRLQEKSGEFVFCNEKPKAGDNDKKEEGIKKAFLSRKKMHGGKEAADFYMSSRDAGSRK